MDYDRLDHSLRQYRLKLNEDILFKWQRHSHESGKVPHTRLVGLSRFESAIHRERRV